MDKIAQRLFGIAAIVFAFAALIYSTNPATAAHPNTGYESGKYQMSFTSQWDHKNEKMGWYILVWDTETGRSKMYQANSSSSGFVSPGSAWAPPSSPL